MNNNLERSQPDKWFEPFRKNESATLADDERLAFVLAYEVLYTNNDSETAINMFIVVEKNGKAIARSIVAHANSKGVCQGHSDDFAEYDAKDIKTLIEETKNHGITMAQMLANGNTKAPLKINTNNPLVGLQPPKPLNKTECAALAEELINKQELNGSDTFKVRQAIVLTLGLNESAPSALVVAPVKPPVDENLNNLERAAQELALIDKFGKKKMEELAKKMNYKGAVLNKTNSTKKTTTHVK